MKAQLRNILLPLIALCAASRARAQTGNLYAYDDGMADTGLSYAFDADVCWLQRYTAVNGVDTIIAIETAVGAPTLGAPDVPDGTPITLCVWEDPNDDGLPDDAVLVSMASGVVQNSGTGMLTPYTIPAATVHGSFFIGANVLVAGGMTAAPMDLQTPAAGRTWFAINDPPGTFDPQHIYNSFMGRVETLGAFLNHCWVIRARGGNAPVETYCFAKVNSAGCTPQITWGGVPSISAGAGFTIYGTNLLNFRRGFFMYSTAGQALTPFGGGFFCIAQPFRRTRAMNTGGIAGGSNCTGVFTFDFNQHVASGVDPALTLGASVDGQFYYRDPFFPVPNDIGLTGGIHFTLGP